MKSTKSDRIFVNLPVADLPKSIDFFRGLGFDFDQRFTDETASCMNIGENIHAMLLTHEKFQGFSPTPISDAHQATEVLVCISMPSRAAVDEIVAQALATGGSACRPAEDHGWMYGHSFRDPDGHIWEVMHADMAAFEAATQGA